MLVACEARAKRVVVVVRGYAYRQLPICSWVEVEEVLDIDQQDSKEYYRQMLQMAE